MRSDAAIACCRFALTRLSFFAGPYIRKAAAMNERELPGRQAARSQSAGCRTTSAAAMPTPPSSSISGGRLDSAAVTFMFVRNR